jgi:hypothetical protein
MFLGSKGHKLPWEKGTKLPNGHGCSPRQLKPLIPQRLKCVMMDFFGCPSDNVFEVSQVFLHCMQNLFEKLGKSEMKF